MVFIMTPSHRALRESKKHYPLLIEVLFWLDIDDIDLYYTIFILIRKTPSRLDIEMLYIVLCSPLPTWMEGTLC